MKEITYLIYIIFWELLCFVPIFYAVFWLDKSGWWFLLAIIISQAAYSPYQWGIEGAKPSSKDRQETVKSETMG
jgi:hypothetical protein